jgi:SAM-dependent methyltransferase
MTQSFYDGLAPYYHLLYPDWEASIVRQSRGLAAVLQEFDVPPGASILDAACGIGTQALGLSMLGYQVTASDIAPLTVARARREAESRGLHVAFSVADLRELASTFPTPFAAVLACDNAVPHLLSDGEILRAFAQCHRTVVPGGVFMISVRDYAAIERRSPDVRPYGSRAEGKCTYSAEQIWQWDEDRYDLTLRLTEQCGTEPATIRDFHSRYYAVELPTLERLLYEAGFVRVERRDQHFFQPLLVALRAPTL